MKYISRLVPDRTLSVLLVQVFCYQIAICSISAFQLPDSTPCHSRHYALSSTSRFSSSIDIDSMDTVEITSAETSLTWSMAEDWALVDIVPQYTVYGSSSESSHESLPKSKPFTFWTQLLRSTPELSQRTEQEALLRYRELCDDPTRYTSDKRTGEKRLPRAGSSPPLLRDWKLLDKGGAGSSTKFVGGTLIDSGSNVWFPLHSFGCLGHNPVDADNLETRLYCRDKDTSLPTNPEFLASGFAEAAGGQIYELAGSSSSSSPSTTSHGAADFYQRYGVAEPTINLSDVVNPLFNRMMQGGGETTPSKDTDVSAPKGKFSPGTVATVSALFASSILSASIGFGMGIAAAGIGAADTSPDLSQSPTLVIKTPCPYMQSFSSPLSSMDFNTVEPSVSELRARQEAKVFRERRAIDNVSSRLQFDEAKLVELTKQEIATQINYEYDSVEFERSLDVI